MSPNSSCDFVLSFDEDVSMGGGGYARLVSKVTLVGHIRAVPSAQRYHPHK